MTTDTKPSALLPAARLAEIRATFAAHDNGEAECDAQGLADFARDLLAHLDALTAPADGEALGRLLFETEVEHVRREHPEAPVTPPTWDGASPMWQRAMSAGAIALDAHGYARGRAEALEGIDRWKMIAEGKDVRIAVLRDEIARLTAELAAERHLLEELRAMLADTEASVDRWKVASERHAEDVQRLTAELAEARAAVEHARMDVKMTSELQKMAEYDASVARLSGARGASAHLADVAEIVESIRWMRANSDNPGDQTVYVDQLLALFPKQNAAPPEGEDGAT